MAQVFKGNKREIPGGMPVGAWIDKVREYDGQDSLVSLGWYNPVVEYLSPDELRRLLAKVRIWREVTGADPQEISWWWEVRMARRRGDLPHTDASTAVTVDADRVLHCGYCQARWSFPWPDRCKLCDRLLEDSPIAA